MTNKEAKQALRRYGKYTYRRWCNYTAHPATVYLKAHGDADKAIALAIRRGITVNSDTKLKDIASQLKG